ncbi:hypothetical protein BGZ51_008915 [Haplosporangium sp. Z 767]|nr:hypothetical protein BGZ51_008915 [Haplosporangium sp. Z 767]KAF9191059.1 hypothetical protein BGZ50_009672 [Haplosporangium sp. Z 11]
MPPHPIFIPEILNLIFESLDTTSLIAASTVCRVWNASVLPVLWRNVVHLDRDLTFYDRVRIHGRYIHGLDISLVNEQRIWGSRARQLTLILQETPRLKNLTLRLPEDCQPAARQEVYQIIRDYVAGNLTTLGLVPTPYKQTPPHQPLSRMSIEEATVLFPALTQLTTLEMDLSPPDETLAVIVDSLPGLTAVVLKEQLLVNTGSEEYFGDRGLGLLGQKLFQLQKLSINSNQHITSDGLLVFQNHCQTLTHLDLSSCHQLDSMGLERLVESSPLLTHVVLADTLVDDRALLTLAQTTRAARLRSLWIGLCTGVTTLGVQGIVKACINLEELDFSDCDRVSMAVFDGPQWECLRINLLKMGGISQEDTRALPILDQARVHMYQQLGRLNRLVSLDITAMPVELRLFDFGRHAIQNMTRLKRLVMIKRRDNITDKEAIWLATQLPSLRTLLVDSDSIRAQLTQDLQDINCNLNIQLQTTQTLNRPHYDSSDMDEDDDNDGSYYGDTIFSGPSFYGIRDTNSDDSDDSDGQTADSDTSVSDDNRSNSESFAEDGEDNEDRINESDSNDEGEDDELATMAFFSGYYNHSGSDSSPSTPVSEDDNGEDVPRTLVYYSNYHDQAGYSSNEPGSAEVSDDESDSLDSSSQESDNGIDQPSLEEESDPESGNESLMESDIDEHSEGNFVQSDPEDHSVVSDAEDDGDGLDQGYSNESDYAYSDVVEDSLAECSDGEYEDYSSYEYDDDDASYASF